MYPWLDGLFHMSVVYDHKTEATLSPPIRAKMRVSTLVPPSARHLIPRGFSADSYRTWSGQALGKPMHRDGAIIQIVNKNMYPMCCRNCIKVQSYWLWRITHHTPTDTSPISQVNDCNDGGEQGHR